MFANTANMIILAAPALSHIGSTLALPLLPTTAHTSSDLKVFANAFISSSTGGAVNTCDDITTKLGLNLNFALNAVGSLGFSGLGLGGSGGGSGSGGIAGIGGIGGSGLIQAKAFTTTFNKWANTQCLTNYHDGLLCGEVSAYLAATVYAYQRGWAAVEFFAALGTDRVNHWHNVLDNLCGTPGCPTKTCDVINDHWSGWYTGYTSVGANLFVQEALELNSSGLIAAIDAAVQASAHITANANANAGTIIHRGVNLGGTLNSITHLDTSAVVDAGAKGFGKVGTSGILHSGVALDSTLDAIVADKAGLLTGAAGGLLPRDVKAVLQGSASASGSATAAAAAAGHGVDAVLTGASTANADTGADLGAFSGGHGTVKGGPIRVSGSDAVVIY